MTTQRDCWRPGDHEHDHTMCEDVAADRTPQNCPLPTAHLPHGTCAGVALADHPGAKA